MARGQTNGVKNLRVVRGAELRAMEPHLNPDATAALFSPDAGTLIPYEYAIALAENAADNGVEVRIRREVAAIEQQGAHFCIKAKCAPAPSLVCRSPARLSPVPWASQL